MVVLPRLAAEDKERVDLAIRVVSEIEARKIPMLSTLPGLARFRKDVEIVAERLLKGLNSQDSKDVISAMHGIFFWAVHSQNGIFPPIPERTISALAARILALRRPSLETALATMAQLVREAPQLIMERDLELLGTALQYLASETELPPRWQLFAGALSEPSAVPIR